MKRDNFLTISAANYLMKLLDTSGVLWEEELRIKQRTTELEYLKKQNSQEIIAACDQVQTLLLEL